MAHISGIVKVENKDEYEEYKKSLFKYNDGYDVQFVNNSPSQFPCWVIEMFHLTPGDDGLNMILHLYSEPKVDQWK